LGGSEGLEGVLLGKCFQQGQQGWDGVPEGLVKRQHMAGHFSTNRARLIAVGDLEVGLEEVNHGQIRRRLPIRHRKAFEDKPPLSPVGMDELVEQAGFAHARLPNYGLDLAVPATSSFKGTLKLFDLDLAPGFEILQVVVVKAEPAFERPIGHASLALEQIEGLGKDLVKCHNRSSPTGISARQAEQPALLPCTAVGTSRAHAQVETSPPDPLHRL
jgi:hypothetical protein